MAGCVGCNKAAPDTTAQDKNDIQALEDRWVAAVKAKDVTAIMSAYVPDQSLVVFDMIPPLQYTGAAAYQKDWQDFFAPFPGPIDASISDLEITTGGNVAFSHSIQHISATDKDGKKTEVTVRVTDGYKKIDGRWLISHEHVSVPVDPVTMKGDANAK
jgi:uncharacterized protein (TIGR02246 family)